jgi:ABC-2 type transport system permease protein
LPHTGRSRSTAIRAFLTITLTEGKVWLRDPTSAIMALSFPVAMMLLMTSMVDGVEAHHMLVPSLAFAIAMPTVTLLPATFGLLRERQILRRFQATPMRPSALLGAHFIIAFTSVMVAGGGAIVAGDLAFGLQTPSSIATMVLGFCAGLMAMLCLGTLIAAVVPRATTGTGVGMGAFFVSIILAGAMVPLTGVLHTIGSHTPLGAAAEVMTAGMNGYPMPVTSLIALAVWTVVLAPIAVKIFRWS